MLTYRNHSTYEHCTKQMSQAIVMITCNSNTVVRLFCQIFSSQIDRRNNFFFFCFFFSFLLFYVVCSHAADLSVVLTQLLFTVSQGSLKVLQENKERENDCIYLFELESSAMCPTPQSRLGTGSILLIMCVKD